MRFTASLWSSMAVVLLSACTTDFDKYRFGEVDDSESAADLGDGGRDAEDGAIDPGSDGDAPEAATDDPNVSTANPADSGGEPEPESGTEPDPDSGIEPDADTEPDTLDALAGECRSFETSPFPPLERVGPVGDPAAAQFLPGSAFDDLGHALFNSLIDRFGVCVDGIVRGVAGHFGECPSRAHGSCTFAPADSVDLFYEQGRKLLMGVSGVIGRLTDGRTCVVELVFHTRDGRTFEDESYGPFGSAPAGSIVESFSLRSNVGGYLVALYGYISTGASGAPEAGQEDFCISSLGATFGEGDIFGS
jgi:hypothetical protein